MSVKVCHLTSVHSIDDDRIYEKECISLAKNGFDVTLIACGDKAIEEIKEGVKIISLHISVKNRIERVIKRGHIVYKKALEIDADIYHIHDPELISYGVKLKRSGKKLIFDSHEDVPKQILGKKWIPKLLRSLTSYLYSAYEKKMIKKFDRVITVNKDISNRFSSFHSSVYTVTNFPLLETLNLTRNLHKESAICFAGSIKRDYMHHNIIRAIEGIEGIKYILAGNINTAYLQELNKLPGWKKVEYVGYVNRQMVLEIYNRSSVGMAVHDYTPNVGGRKGGLGFIKNFEFMMAGIPIICTDFNVWKEIIKTEQCGIYVNPHDIEEISNAIKYLINNPEIAKQMGENGRKAVLEKYNWSSQEAVLISLYRSL